MPKIISVVDKPVADTVSDEAYFLGIQDNGEGKQGLCRLPYKNVCRQLNSLSDEDIQTVKEAALGEVTKAAKNAQDIADDLKKRAEDGEFNGKDYRLTYDDIQEIAEQAATLAGAMQGGTITYKIPKKYYQTEFGDDTDKANLNVLYIHFGKAVFNAKQLEEDIEAGIIEFPEDFESWEQTEQDKYQLEIYKKYVYFDMKPWVPEPRVSWVDFLTKQTFEMSASISGNENDGGFTAFLNKIWNNDFKISIYAENSNGETAYNCIKSDILSSASDPAFGMIPLFGFVDEYDEKTGIETVNFMLAALGGSMGYGSVFDDKTRYVTDDEVKEVTITFIPNNAYVEEFEDEETE